MRSWILITNYYRVTQTIVDNYSERRKALNQTFFPAKSDEDAGGGAMDHHAHPKRFFESDADADIHPRTSP